MNLFRSEDQLLPYAEAVCKQWGEHCQVVRRVGNGNSATVYEVSLDGKKRALKIYEPRFFEGKLKAVEKRRVLDQIALKQHGNPYLIDFIAGGEIQNTYFLLMEFFPWPTLEQYLESVIRSEIWSIVAKIAAAAQFLEERGLVHRDIKPANILISKDCKHVKLLDLGVLRTISATENEHGTDYGYALPFVATAQYSSPAYLFRDDSPTEEMWRSLTFYQLGAVLHDLIMKKPIFDIEMRSKNRYRVAGAVLLTKPKVIASDVDPRLIGLARNCLDKDDRFRLERVSWSSFGLGEEIVSEGIRRMLGLGKFRGSTQGCLRDKRRSAERLGLRIAEATEILIEFAQHALQINGFPRTCTRKLNQLDRMSSVVSLAFHPCNAKLPESNVVILLQLSVIDALQLHCEVTIKACLSHGEVPVKAFDDGECLWNTTLDDLKAEDQEMEQILGNAFIRYYALAHQHVVQFEEQSQEVSTMYMKVR